MMKATLLLGIAVLANSEHAPSWKGAGNFDMDFKGVKFGDKKGLGLTMDLHLMEDKVAQGAVCLDGSPAGFYFSPAADVKDRNNWQIYFEGGGWCYDDMDCYGRSSTGLGSSTHWASTMGVGGIMSDNCAINPDFCNFNRVFLTYCDGNSFTGNRDEPLVVKGKPLYFRGRRIIDAVLQTLIPMGLWNAENVLLTGCSAGGLATYLHTDYVHQWLKTNVPPLKVFKAASISGFFLDHNNLVGQPVYEAQMKNIFHVANSTHGVNDACIAAYPADEQWKCNFAQYTYPHIQAPFLALNSGYDSWQTGCIYAAKLVPGFPNQTVTWNGQCNAVSPWQNCVGNPDNCNSTQMVTMNKYITDFKADMQSAGTYNKNGNGAFIHSCHTHCEGTNDHQWMTFKVRGVTIRDAFSKWWHQHSSTSPAAPNNYVPCEYKTGSTGPRDCNPTCLNPGN
eukprot:TRINITY_DN421_c1_g1_i4.p1 TRINITY_DN421_c1_g1~~TRINITY_DN421_c1_g1_i4.p1  ORF type:complete len:449 (+),score=126.40 TRINITY_DN421_c1_g1_i4:34-1380(+)